MVKAVATAGGYTYRAARREAKASARDLITQYMKNRAPVTGQKLQIVDETGEVLEIMDVRDVLN